MNSFGGGVVLIIVVLVILLIYALRIILDMYATSVTLKLLQNSNGNFSTKRIVIWICALAAFALLLKYLSDKQQTVRPSATRSSQ